MSASWIAKLQESDSRLHKEDVIKQALEAATLGSINAIKFLTLTKVTYNPYITFGVRKVPDTIGIVDAENPWDDFDELLHELGQRGLTGNKALEAIDELSQRFDTIEWNNFCAPVIRRDLRCGISDKTINKICKGTDYEIPTFGCQLATNSEGRPEMRGTKQALVDIFKLLALVATARYLKTLHILNNKLVIIFINLYAKQVQAI